MMPSSETVHGSGCRFADAQIYYFMYLLNENGQMSNYSLSMAMEVGEDCIRTIQDILREWDFVRVTRGGTQLTSEGTDFFADIPIRLVRVPATDYAVGRRQQGIVVRGAASSVTNGMKQRDSAIAAGAEGATSFTMRGGHLCMPTNWNMDERDPEFSLRVRRTVDLQESDVLVIAGAEDPETAVLSAITVGLNLL